MTHIVVYAYVWSDTIFTFWLISVQSEAAAHMHTLAAPQLLVDPFIGFHRGAKLTVSRLNISYSQFLHLVYANVAVFL